MSDYLGRLVERSLGLAEPVRPRPLALFEGDSPASAPAETHEEAPADTPASLPLRAILHPPAPVVPPPTRTREDDDRPSRRMEPPPAPTIGLHRPPSAEPVHALHPPRDPAPPAPAIPPAPSRRERSASANPDSKLAPVPPPPTPSVIHHVERERLVPAPADPHPPLVLQPVTQQTTVERVTVVERGAEEGRRERTVLQPKVTVVPEVRRVEVLRPAPPPPAPAPAAPPRRGEWDRAPSPSPAQPAAAPEIHVTIGRLEVRAARQPAPQPRRAREQPAVMSLDDYLRQRAGGGKP